MIVRYKRKPPLHIFIPSEKIRGEKMHTCHLCGGKKYLRWEMKFDSGSVEPEEDEVLTGASSSDTGIVVQVELLSGSWAGGDATGYIELKSVTGESENEAFEDDEEINGSVGGNGILTVDTYCTRKAYGIMYPLSFLVKYKGRWYCKEHLRSVMAADLRKEIDIPSDLEKDRGKLP